MNTNITTPIQPVTLTSNIAKFIESVQLDNGAIPWFKGHTLDPWNHCESIMALSISKKHQSVNKAFSWLASNQEKDGSWYALHLGSVKHKDRLKIETNFVAYCATSLWHAYLCFEKINLLYQYFPMVNSAINFVIQYQNDEGDIQWAISEEESLPQDALLTANSSILRSLECAIKIAKKINNPQPNWVNAHKKLLETIKYKSWRFDRTWESKSRFSMDWFYPILGGAYSQEEAAIRIENKKNDFLIDKLACKCVSDEPWVTIAESSELVMAMITADMYSDAEILLKQLQRWEDTPGTFWTGYQYKNNCIWPPEKTTWTAAAVALATDALYSLTPAHKLFTTPFSKHYY